MSQKSFLPYWGNALLVALIWCCKGNLPEPSDSLPGLIRWALPRYCTICQKIILRHLTYIHSPFSIQNATHTYKIQVPAIDVKRHTGLFWIQNSTMFRSHGVEIRFVVDRFMR